MCFSGFGELKYDIDNMNENLIRKAQELYFEGKTLTEIDINLRKGKFTISRLFKGSGLLEKDQVILNWRRSQIKK